ncbi:MAG: hypothetical protein AB2L24_13885 [Mangrovibacterium sp.]
MTAANSLYSTIQQMSSGMGITVGAVFLRFSSMLHQGTPGHYTVSDFHLSFLLATILSVIHLYGYTRLAPDAGDAVRNTKSLDP